MKSIAVRLAKKILLSAVAFNEMYTFGIFAYREKLERQRKKVPFVCDLNDWNEFFQVLHASIRWTESATFRSTFQRHVKRKTLSHLAKLVSTYRSWNKDVFF